MKIIITHTSPDLDAIVAVWLIKKFLPDWADADVEFVQAGEKATLAKMSSHVKTSRDYAVEMVDDDEYIHVDTGLGPLDHHQLEDEDVSAASLTWGFIKIQNSEFRIQNSEKWEIKKQAVDRIIKIVTEIDHFREVFWENPTADYQEFTLSELIEGLKLAKPDNDEYYLEFGERALDALLHNFENRIWAEKEIAENGIKFQTSFGKGIGFETLNDSVLKLAQRMEYVIVVRKDPRKGYVRIKARPTKNQKSTLRLRSRREIKNQKGVDLTLAYEQLKKMDPEATWFLHVGKKMLLNGTTKNPKMKPTKLSLEQIIKVLEML